VIKPTVFCDVCGKMKQDSNHWQVMRDMQEGIWIEQWNEDSAKMPNALHFCGHGCTIKKVQEFLIK